MSAPIRIFQPPTGNELTGGYLYNRRMSEVLSHATLHATPAKALPDALAEADRAGAHILVDSLYIGDDVDRHALARQPIAALIHHLPSLDPGFPEEERAPQTEREQAFIEGASRIVVTSSFMRELLADRGIRVPIVACPPGVDDDFFALEPNAAHDPPEVVTVANLEPRKGYLDLIPPLAALAQKRSFTWHIVGDEGGDPHYARRVRAAIEACGLRSRAVWHGRLERPALLDRLRRACAHILPTRFESYGMVVAETLAAGVPMVAPRLGEIQYLVRDGESGLLADPAAPAELAAALERVLTHDQLRERMHAFIDHQRRALPRWRDAARALARSLEETSR